MKVLAWYVNSIGIRNRYIVNYAYQYGLKKKMIPAQQQYRRHFYDWSPGCA
jgi:hypothetical protein